MAFQKVVDTAAVDHIFTLNGVTVQNTHYAKIPGGYNLAALQSVADSIDNIFVDTFQADMPTEVSYVRTDVRGLAVINDLIATQNAGAADGTNIGSALPNNVTFAIKKGSGLTGRSARGRIFWIGIPESELTNANENFLVSTYITSIVADIDLIRTRLDALAGWEAVLVSRFTLGALRSEGKTFPWVTTTNVDARIDTHRGRLPPG